MNGKEQRVDNAVEEPVALLRSALVDLIQNRLLLRSTTSATSTKEIVETHTMSSPSASLSSSSTTSVSSATSGNNKRAGKKALLVCDLQLSLLWAALNSGRAASLVNPFPCWQPSSLSLSSSLPLTSGELNLQSYFTSSSCPPAFANAFDSLTEALASIPRLSLLVPSSSSFVSICSLSSSTSLTTANATATPVLRRRLASSVTSSSAVSSKTTSSTANKSPSVDVASLPLSALSLLGWLLHDDILLSYNEKKQMQSMLSSAEIKGRAGLRTSDRPPPDFQFDVQPARTGATAECPEWANWYKQFGSILVYHGSPVGNWHSILRCGIKEQTGTKLQSNGALFGAGIYFSDDLLLARQFANPMNGWDKSLLGSRLECVGVFEMVNHPEFVKQSTVDTHPSRVSTSASKIPEKYFVVLNSRVVRLRSLLVWRVPVPPRSTSHYMLFLYALLMCVIILFQPANKRHLLQVWQQLTTRYG